VGRIDVQIANRLAGTIALTYGSQPSCSAGGVVTAWLDPGNYTITAQAQDGTAWAGNATVNAGTCTGIRLN
jgi:hypothetical protein